MIVILALWLALTVLNQFKHGALIRPIKRRDEFALIPTWTFFAPRPGVTDQNLLYRDRLSDGRLSAWREFCPPTNSWLRVLWCPQKRVRKSVSDMCQSMVRIASRAGKRRGAYLDVPYVALLNTVAHDHSSELAVARQFIIVRSYGFRRVRPPQILFASAFHVLDDQGV